MLNYFKYKKENCRFKVGKEKFTDEEEAAFKNVVAKLGPVPDIEITSFYGDEKSTHEMEEALREDRIKKIMKASGVSSSQAIVIEAIESGKTTGDTFCLNEDGSVSPSSSRMIYDFDND